MEVRTDSLQAATGELAGIDDEQVGGGVGGGCRQRGCVAGSDCPKARGAVGQHHRHGRATGEEHSASGVFRCVGGDGRHHVRQAGGGELLSTGHGAGNRRGACRGVAPAGGLRDDEGACGNGRRAARLAADERDPGVLGMLTGRGSDHGLGIDDHLADCRRQPLEMRERDHAVGYRHRCSARCGRRLR